MHSHTLLQSQEVTGKKKDFCPPIIFKSIALVILFLIILLLESKPIFKMPHLQKQDTQSHQVLNDFYDSHHHGA